jgi:Hydrazine synthase alpha subunit middle domain
MARSLSLSRSIGGLSLLALLGLLPGCSGNAKSTGDSSLGDVSKIVYAVRQNTLAANDPNDPNAPPTIDVAGGMGQVMDYGRYMPGGRLEILDLRTGNVENVIEDFQKADVSSVDLSFDATRVVFTMKKDGNDTYHVYWAPLARGGDGKFQVNQLTFTPFDDQNAIWAAGDRIVFTTNQQYTEMGTRADEYNHSRVVTQLASITLSGGDTDRKLCSQNLSHIVTLFSMSDGRVGFSRWEHLENVNDVKVFAMNPDCTQVVAVSGQHGKPGNSVVQVTESNTPNLFYGIVTNRENTIQAGALVAIDARADGHAARFDEEKTLEDAYTVLTPSVPRGDEPSPVGRFRSPATLPDGRLLVSWARGPVNELSELSLTPPNYGLYVFDPRTAQSENLIVKDYKETWELYARPVVTRPEPQLLPSTQNMADASVPVRLGSINVRETSLSTRHGEHVSGAQFDNVTMDAALNQAVKVRIIEGFSTEATGTSGVTMFGLTMAEGAALIGEATVQADGSWLAEVPPYVPMHLQPVDEFDLAIRSQTTWIQGMPGEDRVCGGCHEDRNQNNVTPAQFITTATGGHPQPFMIPVAQRTEYPWAGATDAANPNQIQTLLTAKCAGCHNQTTNGNKPQEFYTLTMTDKVTGVMTPYEIPRLDLSDRPITVTYDRRTQAWPASYVSIFYPAAMAMEMGMGATVTGTVPPAWGLPSDARHSALIEKLNVQSSLDSTRYAWPLGTAFSDPGIAGGTRTDHAAVAGLTRSELVMLTRAFDMGGQYYSRQNTGFLPNGMDPVAGSAQY